MSARRTALNFVLRWLFLLVFALWFGGFTFYGLVVLTVLHDQLDQLAAGSITRDVTVYLNGIGVIALTGAWLDLLLGGPRSRTRGFWGRCWLLGLISAIQVGLFWGHAYLANWLDERGLKGFYQVHTIYLNTSTAQWGACILYLGLMIRQWTLIDRAVATLQPTRESTGE